MRYSKILLCFTFVISMVAGSCSKEGPQGPAGPQGEPGIAGEPGVTGARGPQGKKGDKGTANVMYSTWKPLSLARKQNDYYGSISAPKLSQNILDKGAVAVYMRTSTIAGPVYNALDYYYVSESSGAVINYILARPALKKINIQSDKNFNNNAFTSVSFRYVLIPGGLLARQSAPLPKLQDYHAVRAYYGIPE